MSEEKIQTFLHTHTKLVEAVTGLTEEQLKWKPAPEKWSVTEVLAHLADHSIVISFRIRDILAGSKATLPAFEQDAWVSGQHANKGEAADILAAFHGLLHYNSLLLRRIPETDWEKAGTNFKGNTVRVADIVHGFAAHVNNHLGQIDRIHQAWNALQSSSK